MSDQLTLWSDKLQAAIKNLFYPCKHPVTMQDYAVAVIRMWVKLFSTCTKDFAACFFSTTLHLRLHQLVIEDAH